MKNYRLKFFIDFEGTITKNDVWINSLGKFINDNEKFDRICEDLHSQKIDTRETMIRQLELVENFSLEKFNSYLDLEEIDEYFKDFAGFCKENDFEIFIVSGGLDYYISYILARKNIDVKFYACKMVWNESTKKLNSELIYTDEYCRLCETCKRNILINATNDLENDISVYIGDGESDYCASRYADIVFAKRRLASYCWKNNITYFEYKNFGEIKNKIIQLTEKKIGHRREAMIRRRDVIMGG
ncbi:MAG: HAD-IB family phosphatase [bacterium]